MITYIYHVEVPPKDAKGKRCTLVRSGFGLVRSFDAVDLQWKQNLQSGQ
jgi:hypothetical protein